MHRTCQRVGRGPVRGFEATLGMSARPGGCKDTPPLRPAGGQVMAPAPSRGPMRVVFMGTPAFAVPTLDALVAAGHEVLGVVAQPDRPVGRGQQLVSPPTVQRARELGLEVRQPRAVKSGAFPEWLETCGAELAVVVAYGRILTPRLLAAPRRGCLNVHASLLPKYRGAAPIQWAVVRGETVTGVTTMKMAEGLDTGDMLLRASTPIGPDEDAEALAGRLSQMGAALLVETLARLDELVPEPQDEALATFAPLLTKEHGILDWSRPAGALHDQIRGLKPWPGASCTLRGEALKVSRARVLAREGQQGAPGEVLAGAGLLVACGQGSLEILEGQAPGRRVQPGRDLINGLRIRPGEVLA